MKVFKGKHEASDIFRDLGRKAFSTNGVAEKIKKPYVHKKETH
jgi:hypothetical protein